ncbi:MAG: hypothetical protein OEN00_17755, partial [Gemmatimonadota bacterium]|nr:hypothetical protein [Gemmatimonadota bacterium]
TSMEPVLPVESPELPIQPVLEPPPHTQPIQQPMPMRMAVGGALSEPVLPLTRFPERSVSREQIEGLDIPTFIRRQMD